MAPLGLAEALEVSLCSWCRGGSLLSPGFPCGGLVVLSLLLAILCACGGCCLGACCSCLALRPRLRQNVARVLLGLLEEPGLVGGVGADSRRRAAYKSA